MILLFIIFSLKHLICDFFLQRWSFMYFNKGTYGHWGGILHAVVHSFGCFIILINYGFVIGLLLSLLDGIIHYHIDWTKINICRRFNLNPSNSEWYWHLLGIDQFLHYLTYIGIIWAII